jgi:hypothetical protein
MEKGGLVHDYKRPFPSPNGIYNACQAQAGMTHVTSCPPDALPPMLVEPPAPPLELPPELAAELVVPPVLVPALFDWLQATAPILKMPSKSRRARFTFFTDGLPYARLSVTLTGSCGGRQNWAKKTRMILRTPVTARLQEIREGAIPSAGRDDAGDIAMTLEI